MEIEAKFALPDRIVFERLLQIGALAGFSLGAPQRQVLHDHYLDTAEGAFLRGGYTCRVRLDGEGGRLLTLKSLTPAEGAWHERDELEVWLPPDGSLDIAGWPPGAATALASQLSAGQPLVLLFEVRQERYQRLAAAAGSPAPAVELSIDATRFGVDAPSELLGVEAELLPAGDVGDLRAIADELQHGWGLQPEMLSKFERGLAQARPDLVPA